MMKSAPSTSPPTYSFFAIPTPPSTFRAPVVLEVGCVVSVTITLPDDISAAKIVAATPRPPATRRAPVIAEVEFVVLPTYSFFAIPTPPATCRAPVVLEVESVVLPTCMVPLKLAFPVDADIVAFTSVKGSLESFIVKSFFAVRVPLVLKPAAKKPVPPLLIEALIPALIIESPP